MSFEKTKPAAIAEQLAALRQVVGKTRTVVAASRADLSPTVMEGLVHVETNLDRLVKLIGALEAQYGHRVALAQIGQVVNSSLELEEVLRIVMDTIVRLTRAERGFLMLRDERGQMVTTMARNWEQASISPSESSVSRTVIQKVIESGEAILTTNAQEDARLSGQDSIVAFNLLSILCVPLKLKNELIGVIYADNRIRSGIFHETERDLLVAFANQAAVAIDNARLFSSLKHTLAEVTELKNLMDNIFASIASGVITTDISDKITLVNHAAATILGQTKQDIEGHRVDEVLASVSEALQTHLASVRLKDESVVDLELSPTLPAKGSVDWRFNLSPLKDAAQRTQGVAIVLDDLTERKRLEAQRKLFERMVSPAVISQLDPNQLALGGRRTDITVLFADIRGFTTFSEHLSPEQLVSILNRYLAAGAEAVLDEEGTA